MFELNPHFCSQKTLLLQYFYVFFCLLSVYLLHVYQVRGPEGYTFCLSIQCYANNDVIIMYANDDVIGGGGGAELNQWLRQFSREHQG